MVRKPPVKGAFQPGNQAILCTPSVSRVCTQKTLDLMNMAGRNPVGLSCGPSRPHFSTQSGFFPFILLLMNRFATLVIASCGVSLSRLSPTHRVLKVPSGPSLPVMIFILVSSGVIDGFLLQEGSPR